MEKLNLIGLKLLQYNKELPSYDNNIRDAVITSLDVMINQGLVKAPLKDIIISERSSDKLKLELEKYPQYKKSPRDLYKEFEKIRVFLDEELKESGLQGYFETESVVEFSRITILRQYSISKDFLMEFFGVEEIDIIQFMKKRGFAEKFAVLRLNKIFDEILTTLKTEASIIQSHSMVYYNPAIMGFSIDCKYHLNIDMIEEQTKRANIISHVLEIDRKIEERYNDKLGIGDGRGNRKYVAPDPPVETVLEPCIVKKQPEPTVTAKPPEPKVEIPKEEIPVPKPQTASITAVQPPRPLQPINKPRPPQQPVGSPKPPPQPQRPFGNKSVTSIKKPVDSKEDFEELKFPSHSAPQTIKAATNELKPQIEKVTLTDDDDPLL